MDQLKQEIYLDQNLIIKQKIGEEQSVGLAKKLEEHTSWLQNRASYDLYFRYSSVLANVQQLRAYCMKMNQAMNDLLVESKAVSTEIGLILEEKSYEIQQRIKQSET